MGGGVQVSRAVATWSEHQHLWNWVTVTQLWSVKTVACSLVCMRGLKTDLLLTPHESGLSRKGAFLVPQSGNSR